HDHHLYLHSFPTRRSSDLILETSSSLRGVPSGFERSHVKSPRKPTTSRINSANSRMEMSSPQPILIISGASYFSSRNKTAAAKSDRKSTRLNSSHRTISYA